MICLQCSKPAVWKHVDDVLLLLQGLRRSVGSRLHLWHLSADVRLV